MPLAKEKKINVIDEYKTHEGDTGSSEVQIALLSARIKQLTTHFDTNKKDHASRRGLLMMVGRRRKLLKYLKTHNEASYKKIIGELGIRK